jgi:hypothetical protein
MSFQELLSGLGSSEALTQAAGRVGLSPDQAQDALHGVLEHMNGGGSLDEMATSVAAKVGLSPDQVQAFLPHVMPLLQGHADGAPEGSQGLLGGLMGRLGGLFGGGGQTN